MKEQKEQREPVLLRPAAKDYLWGGSRLNDDYSKGIDVSPLAETWECSTHPDGVSTVASGIYAGRPLTELLHDHPDYLGTHPGEGEELPIIVKFIDAKKDLSVQVHPDDEYARVHENGQKGKTEMWYVIDAARGASILYGFNADMTAETVRGRIADGTVMQCLHRIDIKKDDVFFIPSGTVHAIGAGTLVAEIQENSNVTYRLYDYDRKDRNGQKRPLHIDKALDVADLNRAGRPRQPLRVLRFRPGCATELLSRCACFQVERLLLNTEATRHMPEFSADSESFQVFLCVSGCGVMYWQGDMINFYQGDCIFVPASSIPFRLHGKAQFLKINS